MSDMTREEAIKMLEYIKHIGNGESEYKNDAQAIAIDMAIQALEQISILKEAYNKGYKDGQEAIAFHLELCKEEGSIIEIPEGVTNGDIMKAMFSNDLWLQLHARRAKKDWWNSPYRKEQK